jgi:copper chaperone CopZ
MKFITTLSVIILALTLNVRAESTVTLTGVHNCCKKCENGITGAVAKITGASATAVKDTVTITAKDDADAKKAVASLVEAGYFGAGAEAPAVTDAKVKSATVEGVHLCCGKCVDAFNKAATATAGVAKTDAVKGATSVKVEGDFSTKEFLAALNKGGFSGKLK